MRMGLGLSLRQRVSGPSLRDSGATNLVTAPKALDSASWTKTSLTVTADTVTAPDGTLTADTLNEPVSASTAHYITSVAIAMTPGIPHTATVFVKQGSGSRFLQLCGETASAGTGACTFDLATNTVTPVVGNNSSTGAMVSLPNGWKQCSWTFTPVGGNGALNVLLTTATTVAPSHVGDGTSTMHAWNVEFIAGSSPGPISYA